jgi:hypothetical protein
MKGADTSHEPGSVRSGSLESGEGPPGEELARIADRALVFQGYLLRRAWGVYYAIWSAALTTFFIFPALAAAPLLALPWWGGGVYYATLLALVLVAIWATSWAFGQTFRSARFRQARYARRVGRRRFLQMVGIGLGIFALVTAIAFLSSFAGLLVLDASLGVINLWLLLAVRRSFPRVPPEGTIAVATYAASILGSAAALLVTHDQLWFGLSWIVGAAGWAFCGVYALYHAPEEMTLGPGS